MPKNPLVLMLLSAGVAIWQLIELTSPGEAASQSVALLHYVFLGCALLGVVGGGIQYAGQKSRREGS